MVGSHFTRASKDINMLKSWSIQNFKPILNSGELKLAPVTVLAGRNSSGKSSLIQSILMIAQTLSSRVLDRPLLPHGSFAHLGTFEDVLNKYSEMRSLTIGFQLEMEKEELTVSPRRTYPGEKTINRFGTEQNINSVKVISQFLGAVTNGTSSSAIEASKVSVEKVSLEVSSLYYERLLSSSNATRILRKDKPFEFSIDIRKLTDEELGDFLGDVVPEYLRLVPYTIKESNYLGIFNTMDQAISKNIPDTALVAFSHFLPSRLIVKFKVEERRKQRLMQVVARTFAYPDDNVRVYRGSELFDPDAPMPVSLNRGVLELCKNEKTPEAFPGQSVRDLAIWYKTLKLGRGRKKSEFGSKLQKLVTQGLMEQTEQSHDSDDKASEALESMINNIFVENLEQAVEQITRFFTSKIRYLGPLRADPEILQGF